MKSCPLRALVAVTAGQGAPKQNEFSDTGIPFIRAGSLEGLLNGMPESSLELVSPDIAKRRKLKLYHKGSVLFAKSGLSAAKNRVYIVQNNAYIVSHLAILVPHNNVSSEYIKHALRRYPPSSLIKDPAYPAISLSEIESFEIPTPNDPDDQRRIAFLLETVDGLILERKKHLQQMDILLQSIFKEMFGDPVRNEKGWDKKILGQLLKKIESGESPKCENRNADDDEWGVLKLGAVTTCHYISNQNKAILKGFTPRNCHEVKKGDLLFSRKNTYDLVAACAYVFETRGKLLLPDLIFRLQFKQESPVNKLFMWKLLTAVSQRKEIQALAGGSAGSMPNIGKEKLKTVKLPIPPLPLQNQFAAIVEKVEGIKALYQESLAELENLYGILSQKAFRGELDLTRVPLPVEVPPTEVASSIVGPATASERKNSSFPDVIANLLGAAFATDVGTVTVGNGVGTSFGLTAASLAGGAIGAVMGGALAGVTGTVGAAVLPSLVTTMGSLAAAAIGLFSGFDKLSKDLGKISPQQHANNESLLSPHTGSNTPEIFAQSLHQVLYASLERIPDNSFTSQDIFIGLKQGCESYQPQTEILEELLRSNWLYEVTKLWIFDALTKGHIQQFFNDQENTVSFRRVGAQ